MYLPQTLNYKGRKMNFMVEKLWSDQNARPTQIDEHSPRLIACACQKCQGHESYWKTGELFHVEED